MSDAATLLRQRARLFAEQQKKRAAAVKAEDAKAPTPAAANGAPQPADHAAVKRESVADLFAAATTNGGDTSDAGAQQRSNHKRPLPTFDDSPVDTKKVKTEAQSTSQPASSAADVDPLDAYIADLHSTLPPPPSTAQQRTAAASTAAAARERFYGDDEGALDEDELDRLSSSASQLDDPTKRVKRKQLDPVDHSAQHYIDIRKDFWLQAPDITRLTDDEVAELRREELEGVKIRGKRCPRPFVEWRQCGLLEAVMQVIRTSGYGKPFPIQAQAIPAIMSGRDVIACAKTGSGQQTATHPLHRPLCD